MEIEKVIEQCKDVEGYWYLASPYSKYPDGTEWAYIVISCIAANLMRGGITVLCPIAGSHAISLYGNINGHFDAWEKLDKSLIQSDQCQGIIAAKLPSWEISEGMKAEMEYCRELGKPVVELDVE